MCILLFDVDGVLLDTMEMWDQLAERLLLEEGSRPRPDLQSAIETMTLDQSIRYMKSAYHLERSTTDLRKTLDYILEEYYQQEAQMKGDAASFLKKSRSFSRWIVSSGEEEFIRLAFQRLGILKEFRGIFSSSQIGKGKDDPDFYRLVQKQIGVEDRKTFLIDDSPYALKAAREAGLATIGMVEDHNEKALLPYSDQVIHRFQELEGWISNN